MEIYQVHDCTSAVVEQLPNDQDVMGLKLFLKAFFFLWLSSGVSLIRSLVKEISETAKLTVI